MKPLRIVLIAVLVLAAYLTGVRYFLQVSKPKLPSPNDPVEMLVIDKPQSSFDPVKDCASPFGALLGIANRTPSFSNCINGYQSSAVSYFNYLDPLDVREPAQFADPNHRMVGSKWSSNEFVIRWLMFNRGVATHVFNDVEEIWGFCRFFNPVRTGQRWAADTIINYEEVTTPDEIAFARPRPGDLLIYKKSNQLRRGHMAVIIAIENDIAGAGGIERYKKLAVTGMVPRVLYLAEQNFDNKPWQQEGYSRKAFFKWREPAFDGDQPEAYIEDDSGMDILGRVRIGAALVPDEELLHKHKREGDEYDGDADL